MPMQHRYQAPHVYAIAPMQPFLPTLVEGITQLTAGDSQCTADLTILLPTRRACRALKEYLLQQGQTSAVMLPNIRPIGDQEEFLACGVSQEAALLSPVSPHEQQCLLMQLIQHWDPSKQIDEVARFATALGKLLDEMHREQCSLANLTADMLPQNLASHWQDIASFLSILATHWPAILEEKQWLDIGDYRNRSIALQIQYWEENPPQSPIIIAGSTGSTPATAQLMQFLAKQEQGYVVLGAFDSTLAQKEVYALDPYHPHYLQVQWLAKLGIEPNHIQPWHDTSTHVLHPRSHIIKEMMRPTESIEHWSGLVPFPEDTFSGLSALVAPTIQEEALIIAMQLRSVLETPSRSAALITYDRSLAKRVSIILKRWGIAIDDSTGNPLSMTQPANFLKLIMDAVLAEFSPVAFLALLKHPYCRGGVSEATRKQCLYVLETRVLRGVRIRKGLEGICEEAHYHCKEDNEECLIWLKYIAQIFAPLVAACSQASITFSDVLVQHLNVAELLAATDQVTGDQVLWCGEEGQALAEWFASFSPYATSISDFPPEHYNSLLFAWMEGGTVRSAYGQHPRLHILTPMEARLLTFDYVICGGLNEGIWPEAMDVDLWMNQAMRQSVGLPGYEKKVGLSALDFIYALSAEEVVLIRSSRGAEGAPTLPCRWLLRLHALLEQLGQANALLPEKPWKEWAHRLLYPETIEPFCHELPSPPIEARPTCYSVSQIATLMQDPYAIYAEKILGLKALDPLDQDPGAADFGNMIHTALDQFVKHYDAILPANREAFIVDTAQRAMFRLGIENRPAILALWGARIERVAQWFVRFEVERQKEYSASYSEIKGSYRLTNGMELIAKADRIDLDRLGGWIVSDYKTGVIPSKTDIRYGFAPQLTLEAVMLKKQGFTFQTAATSSTIGDGVYAASNSASVSCSDTITQVGHRIASLTYIRLTGGEPAGEIMMMDDVALDIMVDEAEAGVEQLLSYYMLSTTPYYIQPWRSLRTMPFNCYEHLERV